MYAICLYNERALKNQNILFMYISFPILFRTSFNNDVCTHHDSSSDHDDSEDDTYASLPLFSSVLLVQVLVPDCWFCAPLQDLPSSWFYAPLQDLPSSWFYAPLQDLPSSSFPPFSLPSRGQSSSCTRKRKWLLFIRDYW